MAFKILVNGEEVFEAEELVSGVSVQTRKGEAMAMRVAQEVGAIDVILTFADAGGGYPDLDAKEAVAIANLNEAREGNKIGPRTKTDEEIRVRLRRASDTNAEEIGDDFDVNSSKAPGAAEPVDDRPNAEFRLTQTSPGDTVDSKPDEILPSVDVAPTKEEAGETFPEPEGSTKTATRTKKS